MCVSACALPLVKSGYSPELRGHLGREAAKRGRRSGEIRVVIVVVVSVVLPTNPMGRRWVGASKTLEDDLERARQGIERGEREWC